GDCAQDELRFQEAENQYNNARDHAPGDTLGYSKLLKLHGRRGALRDHEGECKRLAEKIALLNPEDEYQADCDLADLFLQDASYDKANGWFEKAIKLDPQRPGGRIALAASWEKQDKLEAAAQEYEKAISNAPDCYDGYWGLTRLYEKQENWRKAL